MRTVEQIAQWLEQRAPLELAESWDNVGLLVGDPTQGVGRLMVCLTLTGATVDEALDRGAEMVVAHHPLPFRPLQKITPAESTAAGLVWRLARHGVSVYSPHTAFDSAAQGINRYWADRLGLRSAEPLRPAAEPLASGAADQAVGGGRWGRLDRPLPLPSFVERVKGEFGCRTCKVVAAPGLVQSVAVACGSAGEFLADAVRLGCDTLITGETSFHTCLEAQARCIHLILVGHYASERPGVEHLAAQLQQAFTDLEIWPSRTERDPIGWM